MGQRYLRMEDQEPMLGLARNQDFAVWEGLNQKLKCFTIRVKLRRGGKQLL